MSQILLSSQASVREAVLFYLRGSSCGYFLALDHKHGDGYKCTEKVLIRTVVYGQ